MSLRLKMLQAARLAPRLLGQSTGLVREFVLRQQNPDGGFRGRDGRSDLYYTGFALGALAALERPDTPPQSSVAVHKAREYLTSFNRKADLDLVHLCCWIQSCAHLSQFGFDLATDTRDAVARLEPFRSANGGYHLVPAADWGTAYGAFLALGAYQDAGCPVPSPSRIVDSVRRLQTSAGGFLNELLPGCLGSRAEGGTNTTAAAVGVLHELGQGIDASAGQWLMARTHPQGGFFATSTAPIPDLLSTATGLHALALLGIPIQPLKERCVEFLDTLWTNQGAFHGHWADDQLDCEYTFYGLLALGHLV
jgi:prenyltransferase beta subunit